MRPEGRALSSEANARSLPGHALIYWFGGFFDPPIGNRTPPRPYWRRLSRLDLTGLWLSILEQLFADDDDVARLDLVVQGQPPDMPVLARDLDVVVAAEVRQTAPTGDGHAQGHA